MSGDAQPRKRKDKKKKKGQESRRIEALMKEKSGLRKGIYSTEDVAEEEILLPPSSKHPTDEVIHVQKEGGCGGNVFTKLIFFCLLATLGVMIGLILLEYRGSTDEETSSASDSPWSLMFQDWIDKTPDSAHGVSVDHKEVSPKGDHDEEEVNEEHEEPDLEESHVEKESSDGLLTWLGFDSIDDQEGGFFGLLGFGSSDKEESDSYVQASSSGWFGFGTTEEEVDIAEQEEDNYEMEEEETDMNSSEEEEMENLENKEFEEEEDEDESDEEELEEENISENENEIDEVEKLESNNDEEEEEEDDDENDLEESVENLEEDKIPEEYKIQEDLDEPEEEDLEMENISNEREDDSEEDSDQDNLEEDLENEDEESERAIVENETVQELEDEDEEDNTKEELGREEEEINDDENWEQMGEKRNEPAEDESDEEEVAIPEEELFPEAAAALKQEAEALAKEAEQNIAEDEAKEKEPEREELAAEDDETEGMALKFGVGVALVVVAHMVLVKKWNTWAGEEGQRIELSTEKKASEKQFTESVDFIKRSPEVSGSLSTSTGRDIDVTPSFPAESVIPPEEEMGPDSEGEEEEDIEVEEEEEELEIDKKEFHDLLAKYGQETPQSSDTEPSEDDAQNIEYSEGEESVGEEEEEEEVVSEDELRDWTGIKKAEVVTPEESESEGELSDPEPPPPPPPPKKRTRGGPRAHVDDYPYDHLTNDDDWEIREELDEAEEEFNYDKARQLYENLVKKYPESPRARYGLARSYDKLAEEARSNKRLNEAIVGYTHTLTSSNITDGLFIMTAQRLINRLRFRGLYLQAVDVHKQLIERYPDTPEFKNELGINYLMINRLDDAGSVFKEVLEKWPQDAMAQAHLGLVFKLQGYFLKAIKLLQEGLADDMPFTRDARLYFHLGDALSRVGRTEDAVKVYEKAVSLGLLRSVYQRSLYNVDRLKASPWWTLEETTYQHFFRSLEANWERIRDEGMKALKLNGSFKDEAEGLRDKGEWKQFELFVRGSKVKKNCEITPFTCSVLNSFEPASTCRRGQSKFSVMEGGTHVWPHCGPTNCRLRAHLGLIVPNGLSIRVAESTRTWEEGKVFVFDDSFEHEVWHNGTSLRLVLIIDVWHPELTKQERLSLSPI